MYDTRMKGRKGEQERRDLEREGGEKQKVEKKKKKTGVEGMKE